MILFAWGHVANNVTHYEKGTPWLFSNNGRNVWKMIIFHFSVFKLVHWNLYTGINISGFLFVCYVLI